MDNLGSLTKRNGILYLIGQLPYAASILGMYYFKDSQGTDYSNLLIAQNDVGGSGHSDIYKITTNAWAVSKADDIKSALPVFTTFLDSVFRTNGSDKVGITADLTTWTDVDTPDTTVPDLKPKYTCVCEDRVYVAHEYGAAKYP